MKVAVLLMIHKNPEQVFRLLKFFKDNQTYCFIHCDKKMMIDIKKFEKDCEKIKKEVIVSDVKRESCFLSTFSMVDAELNLLEAAINYGKTNDIMFDHFHLMSGQDYFINTYESYIDFISSSEGKNIIDIPLGANVLRNEDKTYVFKHFDRVKLNRVREKIKYNFKVLNKFLIICIHFYEILITIIKGTTKKQLKKLGFDYAIGSAWWILSHAFVDYVLKEKHNCTELYNLLTYTNTPEELFFQTILLNSPYRNEKTIEPRNFIYFLKKDSKYTGHPYIFHAEDFDLLLEMKNKGNLLARKFDIKEDSEIFNLLDRINGMGDKL